MDRWLGFPLRPGDMARNLPSSFLIRAGLSAGAAVLRRRRDDTFADYVATGLGRVLGDAFYFPYAAKIWGADPDELSGAQARRRITADSPGKLLRRVLAANSGRVFYYPAHGFGRICEALAEAAISAGATIRLGAEAARIELGGDKATVTTKAGQRIAARQIWSTIPVARLAHLVQSAPASVTESVERLDFRAMLLVYLAVPTNRYSPFDAHYFPEADVAPTRISEPKNYRDGADPVGRTVLCAEIPCSTADDIWTWTDEDLGGLAADTLVRSGLSDPRPADVLVRRIRNAYPVYRLGFESNLERVLSWVDSEPRLITLGRQGLFAHDNTHHALAMGWAAADAVGPDGSFDADRWGDALLSFTSHTVED